MNRKSRLKESLKRGGKRTLEFSSSTAQRQEASRLSNALG
jgi:hypothetical protein